MGGWCSSSQAGDTFTLTPPHLAAEVVDDEAAVPAVRDGEDDAAGLQKLRQRRRIGTRAGRHGQAALAHSGGWGIVSGGKIASVSDAEQSEGQQTLNMYGWLGIGACHGVL